MAAAVEEKNFSSRLVTVVQTFGGSANFHPHVHASSTRGGWTAHYPEDIEDLFPVPPEQLGVLSLAACETIQELMAAAVEEKDLRPGKYCQIADRRASRSGRSNVSNGVIRCAGLEAMKRRAEMGRLSALAGGRYAVPVQKGLTGRERVCAVRARGMIPKSDSKAQ